MGLGKTLQTISIIASDIEMRKREYERTKNPEFIHLPSLVVCPPILVAHWAYEVNKFCDYLKVIRYPGNDRKKYLQYIYIYLSITNKKNQS